MDLLTKHCVPCEGGAPPLSDGEENKLLKETPDWILLRDNASQGQVHMLRRQFVLKNFLQAMDFVNKVAAIAQEEGHHPDIYIFYNKVQLDLYTHAVGGLSDNDFIMAAKINNLL